MYRRIAVPLDGSKQSEHALRWAVAIARRANCRLDLLHVTFPPLTATELAGTSTWAGPPLDELESAARKRLHAVTAEVGAMGVPVESIVVDGPMPDALVNFVQKNAVDLIVMTTHDRGRLERLLLGSVAASVVRNAHLPVLLVRATEESPAIASPIKIEHVLVPLDGSAFANEILPHASELATLMRADLTLLAVLQPVLAVATATLDTGPNLSVPLPQAPDSEGVAPDLPELDRVAESIRSSRALVVHTDVVADGQPARAIVDYAEHHDIDLIAMTTHGRGALKRLVAGSVSEGVIRTSSRPMLVLRPKVSE